MLVTLVCRLSVMQTCQPSWENQDYPVFYPNHGWFPVFYHLILDFASLLKIQVYVYKKSINLWDVTSLAFVFVSQIGNQLRKSYFVFMPIDRVFCSLFIRVESYVVNLFISSLLLPLTTKFLGFNWWGFAYLLSLQLGLETFNGS